ncbi:membrane protein FxsA [Brevibacillus sp. HB1.2]|uniref:Membrane protein FxsA n=1 Tax=Brevibacillus porteri TaxID=2126350 RepID=A0ABX5FY59_9BACL|nr:MULTISPECIES: FxsA family protein [Brevibacillus]MDC0762935.1 membrane protein FxsA [Brevibacillus sp. AG]MED1797680.1 membrane protein FxsA [Brevibacillus porteri]MED2130580.1 membrane protein FxsA [Brevibacillus porteri]MED2746248.1 membrane protein FxsA [Brevibacillus porteri]MED2818042.1 membrane protein FxsA [Brevibacillus porteri]
MFRFFAILFVVAFGLELWGLITIGSWIGGWNTVVLVILTGILGAWLARQQGMQVFRMVQHQLARGQMPTDSLIDGVLILIGGILLLLPGFVTDVIGLVFLIPYTRMIIRHLLKRWLWNLISSGRVQLFFRR